MCLCSGMCHCNGASKHQCMLTLRSPGVRVPLFWDPKVSACPHSGIPKSKVLLLWGALMSVHQCSWTTRYQGILGSPGDIVMGPPSVSVSIFWEPQVSVCPFSGTPKVISVIVLGSPSVLSVFSDPQVSVGHHSGPPKCQCVLILGLPSISVSLFWETQVPSVTVLGSPSISESLFWELQVFVCHCSGTSKLQCVFILGSPGVS